MLHTLSLEGGEEDAEGDDRGTEMMMMMSHGLLWFSLVSHAQN